MGSVRLVRADDITLVVVVKWGVVVRYIRIKGASKYPDTNESELIVLINLSWIEAPITKSRFVPTDRDWSIISLQSTLRLIRSVSR